MVNQLFVHFAPGPDGSLNVRTGIVKQKVGEGHYQLQFDGQNYKFANVFSAQQLTQFAFFDTKEAQRQFLAELQEQMAPPAPKVTTEVEAPEITQ